MTRKRVNPRKDKRIFRKTANRIRKGNFSSPAMRGGLMK